MMKNTFLRMGLLIVAALLLSLPVIFFFYPVRNAGIPVIFLVALILFGLFYAALPFLNEIKHWTKGKKVSLFIFLPLFSVLTAFSIRSEQHFLMDNHWFVIAGVFLGMSAAIALLVIVLIRLLLMVPAKVGERKTSAWKILLYSLPIVMTTTLMFIAFFPGAMTPDSLQQWEQSKTQEFTNWHPVMFTWTIMGLTQIWDSPGIIVLFQMLLFALVIGYMGYVMERFRVHKAIIWGVLIFFAIMPVNAVYAIIIWKDVIYSISLLFFTLLLVVIVKTGGEEMRKWTFVALFLLGSFVLVFFRHNGFPVFVISMIAVLIMYRHMWKRLLPLFLAVIILHEVVTGPVFTALEIVDSDPQEALSIPTQQIANIVVSDGDMTDDQRKYVDNLMALELWEEKYNPYAVDPIKFSWGDYDRWVIYNDWPLYFKTWGSLVVQNPGLAIEAFLDETSIVWQMTMPEDYKMNRFVTNIYLGNEFGLVNTIIAPDLKQVSLDYLQVDTPAEEYIWRPAVYTFFAVLLIYVAYLRNNWRVWLLLLPVALNTAAVMAAIPAQDFRYLFGNSLFFYAAIFIALLSFRQEKGRDAV